jgi:hypothetical protein
VNNVVERVVDASRKELADKISEVDEKLAKGEQWCPARPSTPRASASTKQLRVIDLSLV